MSKRILLSNLSYLPTYGGVENSLYFLSQQYVKKGFSVVVICGGGSKFNEGYSLDDGVEVRRFLFRPFASSLFNAFFLPISILHLIFVLKCVSKGGVDFSISRNQFVSYFVRMFIDSTHVYVPPGFSSIQSSSRNLTVQKVSLLKTGLRSFKRFFHEWFDKKALRDSDKVYLFSQNMKRQAESVLGEGVYAKICKPGVDNRKFYPSTDGCQKTKIRLKLGLPAKDFLVLCIGRLVAAKGFDLVVDAMKFTGENVSLVLVGDGVEGEHLRDKARDLGLLNIVMIGGTSHPELYYRCCDVFVMSSRYEPLGQTILEASASGLPVISLKEGDLIEGEQAEVVNATWEILGSRCVYTESNSAKSLADSINLISNLDRDTYLSLSNASREFVTRNFTWENLANDLISKK